MGKILKVTFFEPLIRMDSF